jgi:excisionase family DNA binding protein
MENTETPTKMKWFSIREAAEYLDVGEPTLYRWMREGKITFRKVGDSTRFWQEDLDSVMQVFRSTNDLSKARALCPVCNHDQLAEGKVRGAGLVYFVPKKTKFWTLRDSFIETTAHMCVCCGAISWVGDTNKLTKLLDQSQGKAEKSDALPAKAEAEPRHGRERPD